MTYLAGEAGIAQFLGIGMDNTHEVAQRHNPAARIVYVDNDPLVLATPPSVSGATPEVRPA